VTVESVRKDLIEVLLDQGIANCKESEMLSPLSIRIVHLLSSSAATQYSDFPKTMEYAQAGFALLKEKAKIDKEPFENDIFIAENLGTLERCVACGSGIPMESAEEASCENGHIWSMLLQIISLTLERCSITLLPLMTTSSRMCISCKREAVSLNIIDDSEERGSFAEAVMQAFDICNFCGGRFDAKH